MKKVLLTLIMAACLMTANAISFDADEFISKSAFGLGASFPFEMDVIDSKKYEGFGYCFNPQLRTVNNKNTSIMIEMDLGIYLSDRFLNEDDVYETVFFNGDLLVGYGYNIVNTGSVTFTVSGVIGYGCKYHNDESSSSLYDVKVKDYFFTFNAGLDLYFRKMFSKNSGFYIQLQGLGGLGTQSCMRTYEYYDGRSAVKNDGGEFLMTTAIIPKIGYVYKF